MKYLQNADDAQDAVMQLYENLSGKIGDYAVDTFRTWLYSVVKNHCLQILRKGNKEIVVDFTENIMESDIVLHLFSEEQSSEEQLQALDKCLEKLPEKQQISVRAFFLDEQSYADIAEQTGYSLKNIKSFIQNGKRNLKICIEKNTP